MISLHVYIACLGILSLITIGIACRAFLEIHRPGARTFGFLISFMAVWSLSYLFEIILPDISHKIISRKMLYFGMTMASPFWLGFALRHTVLSEWWSKYGRLGLLAIPSVITFLLGLTNEFHHLIWQSMKISANGVFSPLFITYGPVFWVHAAVSYLFIVCGIFIYAHIYIRSPKYYREQSSFMVLSSMVVAFANMIFLIGVFPSHIDPTPLSFSISAPLMAIGFFRFGLVNLYPIAAPVIIENLRDAVIVMDGQNHITNINLAAKKWFNIGEQVIGVDAFDILPKPNMFKDKWDQSDARIKFKMELNGGHRAWYDAAITHLYKNDSTLLGRVVVFHDITHEQELLETEFRHSTQMGLLEELGRQISDSLTEKDIIECSVDAIINHFGYAEAAVSLLVKGNALEIAAIAGTQDFGYQLGFKQEVGMGIIGYTAEIRRTYIANDVTKDPYYFSSGENYGSAICLPLINEGDLLGVLYIESAKPNAFNDDDIQTLETLSNQIASAIQRARLYADAQEHLQVMAAVQSISQVVSSSLEIENICQSVVKVLNESFGYTHISIYLLRGDRLYLGGQIGYPEEMVINEIRITEGISGRTISTKETQFIEDVSSEPVFLRAAPNLASEICVPLLKENAVLGTLNVEGIKDFPPLTKKDAEILKMLAGPIALAVDNARLHAQVKILALTDAVSGLHNRHAFEKTLRAEIERATRINAALSLIIFDLDSFKAYNDAWGHPAGDVRLKATADLIRANLRKYDVAARYGGDEFAIILPNTDQEGSLLFAKRLLAAAQESAPEPAANTGTVAGYTLSIGVATFPNDGSTFEALLLAADHAELIAKRLGKNRVVIARDLDK